MLRRLLALIRKELQIVLSNPKSRGMLIMPVVLQVLLFPFAATMEVKHATVAVYNQDAGSASVELVQRLGRTAAFDTIRLVHSEPELRQVMEDQEALVAVAIPSDFSRRLLARESAPLQTILDGRRSNSSQIANAYVSQVVSAYAQERGAPAPTALAVRNIYNPNLFSFWHVLPSLVAIITTIGCLFVTALSVAREREEGTFDQLLVSPLTPIYIMVGKAVPGILIALVQGLFIAGAAAWGFRVPFTGSPLVLVAGIVCYGMSLAGIGLFISSICMTQQQAFFGVFTFMSPAILLSGYVGPIENMPLLLRALAWVNPLTHTILIMKGVFLKGFGFSQAWPYLWPLLAVALCTLSAALTMFRRHIA
jgi:ABC-2 type transport system permease protein